IHLQSEDRSMRISRNFRYLAAALLVGLAIALGDEVPASAQGKTITLSMLAGYKEDVLRASLPDFEKKTGIKVVVDASPFGDLYKKQLLSLSTGAGRYDVVFVDEPWIPDRKSTRLNSSHVKISYAVFCLKKK